MKTRKELKDEYKQTARPMGVYAIRNTTNGRIFVGSAMDLDRVWNSKKFQLELGGFPNPELQAEWKQFGPEAFTFEVLHTLKPSEDPGHNDREELAALEALTIEELQPFAERGYHKPKHAK